MEWHGRRATVMGLGHFGGGVAVARWLARQGAVVTVTDLADENTLNEALADLAGEPIAAVHLSGHREEDFRDAELVVVNPAVRPDNRLLRVARRSGARLATEIELFLERCPASVIGITGSNGKSTTSAMTAAILETDGRRAWLGGNLGGSLLDRLDEIAVDDWVVLEISSFQLWHTSSGARIPEVAVVTGCTPNHLDWHPTWEHYVSAKQRILTRQSADAVVVLNTDDPVVAGWVGLVRGRLLGVLPDDRLPRLAVHGRHNRTNARLAATAAAGVGCSNDAIRRGLASFSGLPGRLEPVATIDRRRFYNDTAATTPESTIAALEALAEPVWLLAGGHDKGSDFGDLAAAIVGSAQGAALYGTVGRRLLGEVVRRQDDFPCAAVETLDQAIGWCWRQSRPGDGVVLSPGCSSHDQFRDYRQRGERFVELVSALGM